jgi:carbamoyl-phosphate synthase small subunit
VITRQYHPEAHPGPHDSFGFFDEVLEMTGRDTTTETDSSSDRAVIADN